MLLDAGSVIDEEVREEFTKFGRRYNRMSDKARDEYQLVMDRLYERIGAECLDVITPHDGHSDIIVPADKSTNGQFKYLWNHLLPGGGAAATVQGEVIRIVGRLGYEALEMGYVNWDKEFVKMTDFWLETVGAAEDAMTVVKQRKAGEADIDALTSMKIASQSCASRATRSFQAMWQTQNSGTTSSWRRNQRCTCWRCLSTPRPTR